MNKVYLIGNLTRDPELSETTSGIAVCRLTIAVNRTYNNEVDYFNITVWRTVAENCGKFLKKGSKVAVCGSLQNRSYEDKDGIKRTVTDIIASEVEFLTPKNAQSDVDDDDVVSAPVKKPRNLEAIDDNQLPF